MVNLTKEQVIDKIAKLKDELSTYQNLLNKFNEQEECEFTAKVKSMVGEYYMQDFSDSIWYCRIDSVTKVEDSNIDGLYAKCIGSVISTPKGSYSEYNLSIGPIYMDKESLEDYTHITKEEFDNALAKFNEKFLKQTKE